MPSIGTGKRSGLLEVPHVDKPGGASGSCKSHFYCKARVLIRIVVVLVITDSAMDSILRCMRAIGNDLYMWLR